MKSLGAIAVGVAAICLGGCATGLFRPSFTQERSYNLTQSQVRQRLDLYLAKEHIEATKAKSLNPVVYAHRSFSTSAAIPSETLVDYAVCAVPSARMPVTQSLDLTVDIRDEKDGRTSVSVRPSFSELWSTWRTPELSVDSGTGLTLEGCNSTGRLEADILDAIGNQEQSRSFTVQQ